MTIQSAAAIAEAFPAEAPHDDWVLSISLEEPARPLPSNARWVERGTLWGFFHGLLYRDSTDPEWQGCSDADLVLRAYQRDGEAALSRLRGSFVLAIIDRVRGKVIVVRDLAGSHPLFYVKTGSSVLFAEGVAPLLDQPSVSRALNRAALADHLCHRWPDPHETFFTAVRRLPPGWRAVISNGHLNLERHWHIVPEDGPIQWLTSEDIERFDEVFDRAVDRCLSNGSTGIFLSGGLDSISVAAVASDRARRNGQPLPLALSLAFPDPSCDERLIQTHIAQDLGMRQYLIDFHEAVGSPPVLEQAIQMNRDSATPILNSYHPAYRALARRARLDGVQTILTGQGGDEWLSMPPDLASDLIRRGELTELVQFYATLQRSYQGNPLLLARNVFWRWGLRPLAGLTAHRLMPEAHKARQVRRLLSTSPSWVAPDQEIRAEQRRRIELMLPSPDPPHGFYARAIRTSLEHTLSSWQIEEQYQQGKRLGVKFLHPFWDPDVMEMCCRAPIGAVNAGGRSKGLVRGMVARRFPTLGLERQRKVLGTPFFQSLIRREGPGLANAAGDFPALSALGVVDGRATEEAVRDGLKRSDPRQLPRIFLTLNLEMWARWR